MAFLMGFISTGWIAVVIIIRAVVREIVIRRELKREAEEHELREKELEAYIESDWWKKELTDERRIALEPASKIRPVSKAPEADMGFTKEDLYIKNRIKSCLSVFLKNPKSGGGQEKKRAKGDEKYV